MRNKSGFTIIEVLIVIVIMAVMMGFGFNYIIGWLPGFRARNAARDVYSNLQSARMTAIKQHQRCTVTFRNSGVNDGYDIYFDDDGDLQYDNGETKLREVNFTQYKGDVVYNSAESGNGVSFVDNSVTFLPNGLIANTQGGSTRIVYLQTVNGDRQWEIAVSPAGGVNIEFKN